MARDNRPQRGARASKKVKQLPWREVRNPYPPIAVLSADHIETIHHASLRILEEIGMRILDRNTRDIWARAGATVDHASMMVRFDRELIEETIALAPAEFTLHARNPARNVTVGGNRILFSSVGGPPYCTDLDRGRRTGTYSEMCDFIRVVQSLNIIHQEGGGPFEPMDLPADTRYLDIYYAETTLLDKTWKPSALGHDRAADAIDMACIALGTDREGLATRPALTATINTNSPLQLDVPMAEGLIEMARARQPVVVTPFTLAGAMCPTTLAGALIQQNAEALATIALTQVVSPGAPVVYGAFTSNVDMKSGAPAFGTPEYTKAAQASGQLARRYNLPFRSSNATASNDVDAQAAYESQMSLWGAAMGHANMISHGAGWLEGGLVASFEKLIIDAEMLQMMAEYFRPIEMDNDSLGLAAIAEVGPGGHFFGAAHTLARYKTAFYEPIVSDWRNFETWKQAGGLSATQRANSIWKQLLSAYEQPPMDPAIDEELQAFVARRKREIVKAA
ncbi:MAG TPA: trimethylamine methyltransferase family protein [Aestuariivirga sp.]|nr:trimethylamine methyltransferase family protein [Aestuariivirga sp.]